MSMYDITGIFRKGLRKSSRDVDGGAIVFNNLEPKASGIFGYRPIYPVVSEEILRRYGIVIVPPFPQVYVGKQHTFLLDRNTIFIVGEDDIYPISTYDITSPSTPKAITPGDPWQIADAGESVLFFNGYCSVLMLGTERMKERPEKLYVSTLAVNAGTYYKGRFIFGGFRYGISSTWKDFWKSLADVRGISLNYSVDLKLNQIWWTVIGGNDVGFLFDYQSAMSGYITTSDGLATTPFNQFVLEMVQRNDFGSAVMPSQGEVKAIKNFGGGFIVYTSSGIHLFKHSYEPVTGTPAFEQVDLSDIGIPNGGCVGGDESVHLILGIDSKLRLLTSEGLNTLGYREWFSPYAGNWNQISYDKINNRFFICVQDKTFVLNFDNEYNVPTLSTTNQLITSVAVGKSFVAHEHYAVGLATPPDYMYIGGELCSGILELNMLNQMFIHGGFVGGDFNETYPNMYVEYRFKRGDTFVRGNEMKTNNEGYTELMCNALDFRVGVKFVDIRNVRLKSIKVALSSSENRYGRD